MDFSDNLTVATNRFLFKMLLDSTDFKFWGREFPFYAPLYEIKSL